AERPQLHCGVNSLFQNHFLVFLEPFTFIQAFVFILVGSITGYARAFYHHDASYKGKYLELPFIFELEALCQVIFEKLAPETIRKGEGKSGKREAVASCFLLPASCFLLPASCFLLPASCFLLFSSYQHGLAQQHTNGISCCGCKLGMRLAKSFDLPEVIGRAQYNHCEVSFIHA